MRGSDDLLIRRAAFSCDFDWDQFVLRIVKLHQARLHWFVLEVERRRFKNIGTELFPGLRFREDRIAQRPRAIASFLSVTNFENQFHILRIPEGNADGTFRLVMPEAIR